MGTQLRKFYRLPVFDVCTDGELESWTRFAIQSRTDGSLADTMGRSNFISVSMATNLH
jgi:hypothetical protein